MTTLKPITKSEECSLYEYAEGGSDLVKVLISSTSESRRIVNDPFVYGLEYTELLKVACIKTLESMRSILSVLIGADFVEDNACVLNILRGGLNFGLREALGEAYNWNRHSTAFLSAQRARQENSPEEWYITESNYKKVYLPKNGVIFFGDVVATGTSLEFALEELLEIAEKEGQDINSLIFFTIGGPRSHEIMENISRKAKQKFPSFKGSVVIYFEGCFSVATPETPVSIKYTGTDLLRCNSVMADEFIQSQTEHPFYPLERCTIYDAGSRAFCLPEYLEDVKDYYEKTLSLARNGVSYTNLLTERSPEILEVFKESEFDISKINLVDLCEKQLARF
jgi:hypothetical protein